MSRQCHLCNWCIRPARHSPELTEDGGAEQESEEELCGSRSSLERQGHRGNTTVHVCWHRNTSVSMVDFSVAVEVPRVFVCRPRRLHTSHSCFVAVETCGCPALHVCLSWTSCCLHHRQRTIDPMSFVLLFFSCLCLCPFLSSPSVSVFFHLCPSTLKLLDFTSPASESLRPLSRLQGPISPSVACWYRAHSLSFSDTCWSREVLQQLHC